MFEPIDVNELFEINPDFKVVGFEDGILIIDDWYKNYEQIHDVLQNVTPSKWRGYSGNSDDNGNFKDFYDCRHYIQNNTPGEKYNAMLQTIGGLIREYFKDTGELEIANKMLDFNYYSGLKENVKDTMQFFPHTDNDYSALIYMDKISNGGTAIYEQVIQDRFAGLLVDLETETVNVKYQMITKVIAKPNRLVIFPGMKHHGGVIDDHNAYYKNWRINQVMFITKAKELNGGQ